MTDQVPRAADVPLTHPARWALLRVEKSARLTTRITWALPDGGTARWASRLARRRGRVELLDREGASTGFVGATPATARRLRVANLVAGISFIVGGTLFASGALVAQLALGPPRAAAVVYLVGGVFFSIGGYVSVLQAGNTPTEVDEHGALASVRWRWAPVEARNIGWLSAAILFVGTLFFAVSLVSALALDLTPRQIDGWGWLPDMIGCVCFLVSGHLALVEVGHGRIWRVVDDLGWWIVAINQLGSITFFVAGLAAFVRPGTSTSWDLAVVNWGTFAGAVCFAVAGVMQLFERP